MKFNPSPIWQSFGAHSHEEFEKKFVIKGHFHSGVNKNVVESYKTIEALLNHAYYEYKFLDVALNQLLGLFEMAIATRCKELEIPTTFIKDAKEINQSLSVLIDQLMSVGLTQDFKPVLHHLRELRNFEMHPRESYLMGTLVRRPMIPALNIINHLFLPKVHHLESKKHYELAEKHLFFKQQSVYVLQHENRQIMVIRPKLFDVFQQEGEWVWAVLFEPLQRELAKALDHGGVGKSLVYFLNDVKQMKGGFVAKDMELKTDFYLEMNDSQQARDACTIYEREVSELDSMQLLRLRNKLVDGADHQVQEYIYKNCWKNK